MFSVWWLDKRFLSRCSDGAGSRMKAGLRCFRACPVPCIRRWARWSELGSLRRLVQQRAAGFHSLACPKPPCCPHVPPLRVRACSLQAGPSWVLGTFSLRSTASVPFLLVTTVTSLSWPPAPTWTHVPPVVPPSPVCAKATLQGPERVGESFLGGHVNGFCRAHGALCQTSLRAAGDECRGRLHLRAPLCCQCSGTGEDPALLESGQGNTAFAGCQWQEPVP